MKRKEVKGKGEKERCTHLKAAFQIARRDKKAFLSDQRKEIEENNRMGKTCVEPAGLCGRCTGVAVPPSCCAFTHRVAFEEGSVVTH